MEQEVSYTIYRNPRPGLWSFLILLKSKVQGRDLSREQIFRTQREKHSADFYT